MSFKALEGANLAGVAQRVEHKPANLKVAGSILGQGICLS